MASRRVLTGLASAGSLLAVTAAADMGQVHVSAEAVNVSESAQKAIILHNDREEVLILGTELKASRQTPVVRFIPFPSEPQVGLAPPGVFERLAELVAKYRLQYVSVFQSKGGPASVEAAGVEIRLATRLGAHDLTVIRVRDTASFRSWVNGYFGNKGLPQRDEYRDAEAVVADYVSRGIDYFVLDAVDLSAETRFVDPVVYRFATPSLYYPLKTSNTFGGKGAIELFVASPATLCSPFSLDLLDPADQALDAAGRRIGRCLDLPVRASTSARLVPEEHDLEAVYPGAEALFGGRPVYLQAFRYDGDYRFDRDVMVTMPQGVAQALEAPAPDDGGSRLSNLGALLLPEENAQCRKVPDRGPCKGLFEAYYFDGATRACQPFFWGGCQGEVPFKTREACEKTCLPAVPSGK